jgi:hypothetical protein
LVRPVLACGCEAWTLTKTDEVALGTFERKILRKIYDPIQERERRIKYNHELYQLCKLHSIVKLINIARLQWAGHLQRMKNTEIPRKLTEWKPEGRRSVGWPRLRWMDGVEEDLRKMKIKKWWSAARNRESWRKILRETEAHSRL